MSRPLYGGCPLFGGSVIRGFTVILFNLIELLPLRICQPNPLIFIAEYVEQGTLFSFLHRNEFNSDRNLMWARQIAAGRSIHVTKFLAVVVMVTFLLP